MIPRRWWDAWCAYVGWSHLAPPAPGALLTVKHVQRINGPRPRDVDASSLESDRDGALKAKIDVACVPLMSGGSSSSGTGRSALPAAVARGRYVGSVPCLRFYRCVRREWTAAERVYCQKSGSEGDNCGLRETTLPHSRLYATSSTGWRRLTPSSRCDEVLEAGATYLLETKTDGVWPRASSRYVVGDRVSARDHTERWRSGKVIAVSESKGVKIRFDSFSSKWDEWLTSDRLRREDVDIDDVSLSEDEEAALFT